LIVEDDPDTAQLLGEVCRLGGYASTCASTLRDGLARVRRRRPDLILADINLPDGDGLEICRLTSQIPVIALSASPTKSLSRRARRAGCAGYLVKPFSILSVMECLRRWRRGD
jgi:DNA-binding response OmpR family regulator